MVWMLGGLFAFLLGALPWGLWIGRWVRGLDVREHGSGNLGATNVYRLLGPRWGILVLLADAAKGVAAVLLCRALTHSLEWGGLIGMAAAVLGHSFSPLAGFRGGKGVAAAAGAWGALAPLPFALALSAFGLVFVFTRIVSLSSIAAAIVLSPAVALWAGRNRSLGSSPVFYFALLTTVLILIRHRTNLARLRRGEEKPLFQKPGAPAGGGQR